MWTEEILDILERIRFNSVQLNHRHTKQYKQYNDLTKWFDLPIIICSVFSSSFQTLNAVQPQYATSITTAISMFITILSSTKLYLNLASNINTEIDLSKSYYILSINIYKTMSLKPDEDARAYLDSCFAEYTKLIEQSNILIKDIHKDLLTISLNNDNTSLGNITPNRESVSLDNANVIITSSTQV
jgi:hypothetical protein